MKGIITYGDRVQLHKAFLHILVNCPNNSGKDMVPNPDTKGESEPRVEVKGDIERQTPQKEDPFDAVGEFQSTSEPWGELDTLEKVKRVVETTLKIAFLLGFVYLFICSLTFLSSAFRFLGGKTAGKAFGSNSLFGNYIAGLMLGVLATVLLQSSSTTTSIVITLVASEVLEVKPAIPMVMGANIGTSVTNTIVAIGQIGEREQFRRAFAGATVHDMFNILCVIVLLPLEAITGYLYHLSKAVVDGITPPEDGKGYKKDLLKKITKPFTNLIVQIDKKLINKIAANPDDPSLTGKSLLKVWCKTATKTVQKEVIDLQTNTTVMKNVTEKVNLKKCKYLFAGTSLSDSEIGIVMLIISLVILITCLICIVKILHSLLKGSVADITKKSLNSEFPKPFTFLTGYVAILVGAGTTMIIQSSSVFTSVLTPLVGLGIVRLERIYPLTVGANIGTTLTGILAALATPSEKFNLALQIALCHLFFNISGTVIWYPVPFLRKVPIKMAKFLGNTTADYRWFSIFYLIMTFFVIPGLIFALSLGGLIACCVVLVPIGCIILFVIIVNVLQKKKMHVLPEKLQTWEFLPKPLRSLEPYDVVFQKAGNKMRKLKRNKEGSDKNYEMK